MIKKKVVENNLPDQLFGKLLLDSKDSVIVRKAIYRICVKSKNLIIHCGPTGGKDGLKYYLFSEASLVALPSFIKDKVLIDTDSLLFEVLPALSSRFKNIRDQWGHWNSIGIASKIVGSLSQALSTLFQHTGIESFVILTNLGLLLDKSVFPDVEFGKVSFMRIPSDMVAKSTSRITDSVANYWYSKWGEDPKIICPKFSLGSGYLGDYVIGPDYTKFMLDISVKGYPEFTVPDYYRDILLRVGKYWLDNYINKLDLSDMSA